MKKVYEIALHAIGFRSILSPPTRARFMITTPSQLLAIAIDMGNMVFAKIIANSPEYLAEIESVSDLPKPQINTTAADNASKRVGFDYEKAILARDERIMHTI